MSSIVAGPPEVEIDYPEGPPMPEGDLQTRRRVELLLALRHWYDRRNVEGAWVCCDINVYYREGDPKAVVAPDIAVAFGVNVAAVENKTTYKVWEASAAPCFALEIASPTTVRTDLRVKAGQIRRARGGGVLAARPHRRPGCWTRRYRGERRQAGRWTPIEVLPDGGGLRARSEALGLDLCWRPPKLRLWDVAAGAWLPDHDDQAQQAALAAAHAARADEQAAARQAAETRADEQAAARQSRRGRARRASVPPGPPLTRPPHPQEGRAGARPDAAHAARRRAAGARPLDDARGR